MSNISGYLVEIIKKKKKIIQVHLKKKLLQALNQINFFIDDSRLDQMPVRESKKRKRGFINLGTNLSQTILSFCNFILNFHS